MEYTIFAKVAKRGMPYRQPGDKIGGEKTGQCEKDLWGIIGRCIVMNGVQIPEGAILHIWGEGALKAVKVMKKLPKRRHRHLYRFTGFEKLAFSQSRPEPVMRVIPLSLEK